MTTLDLGLPTIGTVRVDFCGGLSMGPALLVGITKDRSDAGCATFCRDKLGRPTGVVPIWLIGR